MNKKRSNTLLPLVQLLPAVAAAAAVLFALPRTVPVLAAVPERLTAVVEQPVEAASSEAEEEALPKLLHGTFSPEYQATLLAQLRSVLHG